MLLHSNMSQMFYANIGSSWFDDALFLFVLTPLGFVGLVLNVISLIVFCNIVNRHLPIYSYLRTIAAISSAECLLLTFQFIAYSPRYIDLFNLFERVYECFLVNYALVTMFFIVNVLSVFIMIEKLGDFDKKYRRPIQCFSPPVNISITCVMCSLVTVPFYFYRTITSDEQLADSIVHFDKNSSFVLCRRTGFMSSAWANTMMAFIMVVKDLAILVFEIFGCFLLFINLRRFIASKTAKRHTGKNKMELRERQLKIDQQKKILTVLSMSAFSILAHAVMFIFYIVNVFELSVPHLIPLMMIVLAIKLLSNFFIFYSFNKNFKAYIVIKLCNKY